jgi:hypothetical protein
MATRSPPSLLGITIAPTGMGTVLHLYAGVSSATAVALTAALTVPALAATVIAALIPHLAAIVREKSKAQTRAAVINRKIKAKDAALLLEHDACPPAELADQRTGKQRHSRAGRRRP